MLRRLSALVLIGIAAAGLAVRFSVRDSVDALALGYYALPLPVLGALLLAGGALARRPLRVMAVALGLVTLTAWFVRDYGFARPQSGEWKFVTWNLGGGMHPLPPLIDLVRRESPDLVALVESGAIDAAQIANYERELPGYRVVRFDGQRACLLRGTLGEVRQESLAGRSRVVELRVTIRGQPLRVLIVDMDSDIHRSRRGTLEQIAAQAAREPRTVVLGDFNTPLDSACLDPMRRAFAAANEAWHAGFRETWFYGLPLLSLDQVWLSRDLRPVFARREVNLRFDHAAVIASFSRRY